MIKIFPWVILSLLFFQVQGIAGEARLFGKAPQYAGYTLVLYKDANPVTGEKEKVCEFQIEKDGTFNAKINLDKTGLYSTDFDGWEAQIYLQTGKSYELVLPPLRKVEESDKRSIFFRPETIFFGIKNAPPDELNRMIQSFEETFAQTGNRFFDRIYKGKSKIAADSLKNILARKFPPSGNPYFEAYKFYRLASVEYASLQDYDKHFINSCFIRRSPDMSVTSCQQLFVQIFSNFFAILCNDIDGKKFQEMVVKSDLDGIVNYLISQRGLNESLSRLVILKSVNDTFYSGRLPQNSLLRLLDKINSGNWPLSEKRMAADLKRKLTYLTPGTKAPEVSFSGFDGKKHKLSEYLGQYIYLDFTSVLNPLCRQYLDVFKKNETLLSGNLQILHLIPGNELSKKELILEQKWPGSFFVVNGPDENSYKVRSFPTAYLIDQDGTLRLSPAPASISDFLRQFDEIRKKDKTIQAR